jgi:hypothetical protein
MMLVSMSCLFYAWSLFFNFRDCLEVEDGVQGQHVTVLQLRHHVLHLYISNREGGHEIFAK